MLDKWVTIVAIMVLAELEVVAILTKEDGAFFLPIVGCICILAGAKIGDLATIFIKERKNGKSVDNNSPTGND